MQVINIEEEAFYSLFEKIVSHIESKKASKNDRWISGPEAMKMLRITSKSTLQKYRDEGTIRFSQPEKKHILYDANSIDEFLAKHSNDIF